MSKINIIDIGAVGGFQSPWDSHQDKIGRSLSFEPNEPPVLTGLHWKYDTAVWNFDGEATFYVSGPDGVGSSLLSQNFEWVSENFDKIKDNGNKKLNFSWSERSKVTKQFQCPVKKLDTILEDIEKIDSEDVKFHFLKSDTQSGEFFVLQGAENWLRKDCLALELELFRYPLYVGLVTEEKVIAYLDDLGFCVAGWTGYQNSFNSQADYLFVREKPRNENEREIIASIISIYNPRGSKRLIKCPSVTSRVLNKAKSLLLTK